MPKLSDTRTECAEIGTVRPRACEWASLRRHRRRRVTAVPRQTTCRS